ncbi:MAG: CvpA family protein [Bacteroidia bacterium]|nr:CvpA family protein [Bacteroidia bacterium]
MSKADILLLVLIVLGAFSGYRSGFLMELISLLAIVLGIFGGFKLMGEGMILLQDQFNADKTVLPYISFVVIFLIIVIGVTIIGKMIKHVIDKSFLGKVDQLMGLILGGLKSLFLLSVVIWIVDSLNFSIKSEWTEGSVLYPFTAQFAPKLAAWMGDFIPVFKEIFRQF